jgi:hypothetical protein
LVEVVSTGFELEPGVEPCAPDPDAADGAASAKVAAAARTVDRPGGDAGVGRSLATRQPLIGRATSCSAAGGVSVES